MLLTFGSKYTITDIKSHYRPLAIIKNAVQLKTVATNLFLEYSIDPYYINLISWNTTPARFDATLPKNHLQIFCHYKNPTVPLYFSILNEILSAEAHHWQAQ